MPSVRPTARAGAATLVLALALVTALLGLPQGGPPAHAADLGERLEAVEGRLEKVRQRKGVLTSTIARYGNRIEALSGQVAALRARQARAHGRLLARQAELRGARAALAAAREKLLDARAHLRLALGALRRHLVSIYESGAPDLVSVVVGAGDIDDLAASAEYLDRLRGQDEAVVDRVRDLRNEIRDLVVERLNAKVRIERARDHIARFAARLRADRAALEDRQAALREARDRREAALARISAHEEELDGSVEAIQAEIAARLRETGSGSLLHGPWSSSASGMIWPVEGTIASGFGGRDIGAGFEYHPGIDIAVPEGTPIHAALGGTVAFTQAEAESGGYGNYTCIEHGGGLSTCYAHQSEFDVSPGQSVAQGDVIGLTGCTGYCLGPHLHFEVRIFGEVTDPMAYL